MGPEYWTHARRNRKGESAVQITGGPILTVYALYDVFCGHYIFALWFLSSIFFLYSSPNLSGRRLDVYHTSTHGVALVRI